MVTKAVPARTTKLDPHTFATALDRVASDPHFRQKLDLHPAETLRELGVQIDSADRAALAGKRLSQLIPRDIGGSGGQVAQTYVYVVVGVVIMIGTKVDESIVELSDSIAAIKKTRARTTTITAKAAKETPK
ncbi:MAG: hypothetical protein PW843_10725 [Azospirillaceae bacterium]|nr:hypothetical protein [Azospirillaceae bacterium]